MRSASGFRGYFIELLVIFAGVGLAFGVENLREELNERSIGAQYLSSFREDLLADAEMLEAHLSDRHLQLSNALVVLEFFEGRPVDPQVFFEAYWPALMAISAAPNRNTMDEVLNSGSLRLIRDSEIRTRLLDLYATYDAIHLAEEHLGRDFDVYLYDPTFSSIQLQLEGPWEDSAANRAAVETLVADITVENGMRLIDANLRYEGGLFELLELARTQVDDLLDLIPAS